MVKETNSLMNKIKFNSSGQTYPEIYIPRKIIGISQDLPSLPKEPEKPAPPSKPIHPSGSSDNNNIVLIWCIVSGFFCFLSIVLWDNSKDLALFILIIFGPSLFWNLIGLLQDSGQKKRYEENMVKYQNELNALLQNVFYFCKMLLFRYMIYIFYGVSCRIFVIGSFSDI